MKKILACFAVLAAVSITSSVASAAALECSTYVQPTTSGPTNVMTSPLDTSTGCTAGGMTFSNFNVSAIPSTMSVSLSTVTLTSTGVNLGFQVGGFSFTLPTTPDPDLLLTYEVSGSNITGVDNVFGGSDGTSILETVCDSAGITGNNCTDPRLGFILSGPGGSGSLTFASQTSIYIIKDITVDSNFSGLVELSDFTNSTETSTVPEPMTLSMMGVGLLGLSLISRRRKKN